MGKQSAPAAPNYAPIAAADDYAAQLDYNTAQDQLGFGEQQFAQTWPSAQAYLNQEINSSAQATQEAGTQEQIYNSTTLPEIQSFQNTANNYNTPANANQQAGSAMADVASTFDANRNASLSNLESYGIDPSQTRYGALDLGTRISQAAATAAAGTQSRLNTQGTGLALQGEAINMGMGLQNNVAGSYATAMGAGSAGISAANQTTSTGVNAMGSPTAYQGLGNNALGNQANAMNMGYQNSLAGSEFEANQSSAFSGGVGSLLGTAAMAAAIAY